MMETYTHSYWRDLQSKFSSEPRPFGSLTYRAKIGCPRTNPASGTRVRWQGEATFRFDRGLFHDSRTNPFSVMLRFVERRCDTNARGYRNKDDGKLGTGIRRPIVIMQRWISSQQSPEWTASDGPKGTGHASEQRSPDVITRH